MKSGSVHVCHGIKIQKQKTSDAERELMARFYLNHLDYVNNWDLVDSAPHVLGASSVWDSVLTGRKPQFMEKPGSYAGLLLLHPDE